MKHRIVHNLQSRKRNEISQFVNHTVDFRNFGAELIYLSFPWIRDFGLTKEKSEFLSSRLKLWNMLQKRVKCKYFVPDPKVLKFFFSVQNNVCYCSNIDSHFEALESEHHSKEWKLFIDSSKASSTAVLLNSGNKKLSILLVHVTIDFTITDFAMMPLD